MIPESGQKVSSREIIHSMNYNVKLVFAYYLTNSLGRGMWLGNILGLYVFLMVEEADGYFGLSANVVLGLTSAATGVPMILFVFLAGYLADKYKRHITIKIASVIGFLAIAFLAFITLVNIFTEFSFLTFSNSITCIFISLGLWGAFNAFVNPSLEALFADSIESGYRSRIYSWGNLINNTALAIGPFLNVILFVIFGDKWEVSILSSVMMVGISFSVIAIIISLFLKDKKTLGKESEEIKDEVIKVDINTRTGIIADSSQSKKAFNLILFLILTTSIIIGIGAGMTIKFFPVFFKNQYLLTPKWVQLILGVTSLATGIMGLLAQKISLKLGRINTIFITQFIATTCLAIIAIYPPLGWLITIFIIRGSFMNAGTPLTQSILMDIIKKKNRAKLNSVLSISHGLFWNLSAVIGGFIVQEDRFNLCFIITTFVYIIGLIPLVILIPKVGTEKEALKKVSKEVKSISPLVDNKYVEVFTRAEITPEKKEAIDIEPASK